MLCDERKWPTREELRSMLNKWKSPKEGISQGLDNGVLCRNGNRPCYVRIVVLTKGAGVGVEGLSKVVIVREAQSKTNPPTNQRQ
jgi:hypothetical protein